MKSNSTIAVSLIIIAIVACTSADKNVVKEYYPNGILKSETHVKGTLRNGLTKNYDKNGRLESTAELVNDEYHGWMINYNPENNKVTAKAFYQNDKQNGPASLYYIDGSLYREMTYVDGRVDSIVKTYWANGQLQAEVYFKMGKPAIGLKEFDKSGKPKKLPTIVVEEVNQLALLNKIKLKIYLSDDTRKVKFYFGELIDGKYFDPDKWIELGVKDGVANLEYTVPRHGNLMQRFSIISHSRTDLGNTLVLNRVYNLAVTN